MATDPAAIRSTVRATCAARPDGTGGGAADGRRAHVEALTAVVLVTRQEDAALAAERFTGAALRRALGAHPRLASAARGETAATDMTAEPAIFLVALEVDAVAAAAGLVAAAGVAACAAVRPVAL